MIDGDDSPENKSHRKHVPNVMTVKHLYNLIGHAPGDITSKETCVSLGVCVSEHLSL